MVDKKIFTEDLLKFLKDVLNLCNGNFEKLNYDDEKWPIFFPDGKYKKYETKKIPDYDYFIRNTLKTEIQKLLSYSIITKYLVTPQIKSYNEKILGTDYEVESDFKVVLPLKFILTYINSSKNFSFDKKIFHETTKKFFEFLECPLEDEYVVPLFNFDSDLKQAKKFDGLEVRKISDLEFRIFTNLDEYPNIPAVYKELTDVMSVKVTKNDLLTGYGVAKNKFYVLLESFLLYADGNPQLGTIHRNINNPWIHVSNNFEKDVIKQKTLKFQKKEYKEILKIFNSLKQIDFSKKENKFLDIAIRRFSSALARTDSVDQFIDLMISLEALYGGGERGEITTKLSYRLATLVAKNEKEREDYWEFTKKMYSLRSGIVHGSKENIMPDESLEKIIKLVRKSIHLYLKLANSYSGGGKITTICDDIDAGLVNKEKLKLLKSKLK